LVEASILIIEDNEDLGFSIAEVLRKRGYEVKTALTGEEGVKIIKDQIVDLVLLDIRLPGKDGLEILKKIKAWDQDILVIMMTAFAELEPAIEAMKNGAFDYLIKPFDLDELRLVVEKALETQKLRREVLRLKRLHLAGMPECEIYGVSSQIEAVREEIRLVSTTPRTSVLIQGESGTGKELVANAIHYSSNRRDKPLIKINCSAIPDNLLESELFGHERGAFTDARTMKKGLFELANGGTVFLDEISSLKLSLQPKLLRILETQSLRRVGGISDIKIDVRIIAATNQNLETCVREGSFREDLYYRLKVWVIDIPPLREHPEDILHLAKLFLDQENRNFNKNILGFNPKAEEILLHYLWPGNVRELKNVIERAVILCRDEYILPEHLPRELQLESDKAPILGEGITSANMSLDEIEKRHIIYVLKENKGNKSRTARILGISRSTLREKLRLYGIQDEEGE